MIKRHHNNYEDLALLSKKGFLGQIIPEHRALLSSSLSAEKWLTILLTPALFNFLVLHFMTEIGQIWLAIFEFWFNKLGILGGVHLVAIDFFGVHSQLPTFEIPTNPPDTQTWWLLTLMTAILFGVTRQLTKRFMPLLYIFNFLALFIGISLAYFATTPATFPYTVSGHLDGLLITALWIILIIPWIHALIYYIFDFSLVKKLGLTILSIAFIAIAMPFQLLTQMVILVKLSIILLPVLYVFFGIFLLILCCLAIYGWAMSWEKPM